MEYRLNKYISGSGYCSRREADKFIENGNVTVNGKRATVGMRVLPGQKVMVNGLLIENGIEPVYIAFNKPVGIECTTDTREKDNIIDYICHEQRIFPIGRLDKDSQGLILLTNDGDIVNKILRVGNNHKKEYIVKVNKPITKEFITRMSQGVPILDRVTRKCTVVEINPTTFQISLTQGFNRQIRRMCEYFEYEVVKLERIQVMNIKLGNLGQGNWRNLTEAELNGLFDLLEESKGTDEAKKAVKSKPAKEGSTKSQSRKSSNSKSFSNKNAAENKPIHKKKSKSSGNNTHYGKPKSTNGSRTQGKNTSSRKRR